MSEDALQAELHDHELHEVREKVNVEIQRLLEARLHLHAEADRSPTFVIDTLIYILLTLAPSQRIQKQTRVQSQQQKSVNLKNEDLARPRRRRRRSTVTTSF
ncbi:hypothetical protein BBP40_007952 [Aspergillus hancockii]|nr:hypothetical protein BBP40_007952 [Aspergillus hancockii]